jgi:AraC-like DNA-binding protein
MTVERHLVLQELTLQPSGEWTPPAQGWTVLRVVGGAGYCLNGGSARELNLGDGLACSGRASFVLRASLLGPLRLEFFFVQPQFLNGLLTVAETHRLGQGGSSSAAPFFWFSAQDAIGQKFKHLAAQPQRDSLPVRSGLLQLWAQAVGGSLAAPATAPDHNQRLRERFRELVGKMPDAELATRPLAELAVQLNCSERHFNRLFREEFKVSLRSRQTELRLHRASQLLSVSESKIAEVAQESGYRHVGLFNLMFKKQFGMTPSMWRQKMKPMALLALLQAFQKTADVAEFFWFLTPDETGC